MLKDDNYVRGDYNVMCDLCSLQYKASECRKMWNGAVACRDCFETRHPCDTPPKPSKPRKLPFTRPEGEIKYMTVAERDPDSL